MTTYKRLVIAWLQQRGLETIFVCQREPKLHFDQHIIPKSLFNNGVGIFGDQEQKSESLLYHTLLQRTNFQGGPWSCLEGLIVITDVDNERSDS